MKRKLHSISRIALFLAMAASARLSAQNNNALAFDGVDDNVLVPAASSLIANSNEISLTAWVYPSNPAPNFPNFDGFAGIRNNTDADFYLLQYTPTKVEARFRNSAGTVYNLSPDVLTLNTWTHLAMTYDGSMLRLFKNGVIADSLPASGNIITSAEDFLIGDQLYQGTHYYLSGKVDEVSLWSRALNPSEIICMPINGIDTANAVGLQLYYKFNQGTAGGNNTAITTLTDASGHINGILGGFSLTGNSSNFVAGATLVTPAVAFICPDATYNFNGTILSVPGVYYDTLSNAAGCDSVIQLTLNSLFVDTVVNQSGAVLTANHTGTFYQWLDCNNNYAPVSGATQQSYTPSVNGSYAVIVQQSGCFDTSGCHVVTTAGAGEINPLNGIKVYPTSTRGLLHIETANLNGNLRLQLYDISGRMLAEDSFLAGGKFDFDMSRFARGSYRLAIIGKDGNQKVFPLIRE